LRVTWVSDVYTGDVNRLLTPRPGHHCGVVSSKSAPPTVALHPATTARHHCGPQVLGREIGDRIQSRPAPSPGTIARSSRRGTASFPARPTRPQAGHHCGQIGTSASSLYASVTSPGQYSQAPLRWVDLDVQLGHDAAFTRPRPGTIAGSARSWDPAHTAVGLSRPTAGHHCGFASRTTRPNVAWLRTRPQRPGTIAGSFAPPKVSGMFAVLPGHHCGDDLTLTGATFAQMFDPAPQPGTIAGLGRRTARRIVSCRTRPQRRAPLRVRPRRVRDQIGAVAPGQNGRAPLRDLRHKQHQMDPVQISRPHGGAPLRAWQVVADSDAA
jgi:hypothetical protein